MSFVRFIAGMALATFLTVGTSAAGQLSTTTNNLNLRTGPGKQYRVQLVIPAGAQVDVISCGGVWCIVNFAGAPGYVSGEYLLTSLVIQVSPLAGLTLN
ncbi:MAG: SH3 domain-containing protein [bacterium]|nr:SH3 domain-containing protein [bacterium]